MPQEPAMWLEGWSFQSHLLDFQREALEIGKIITDQWFNQSYLYKGTSIKALNSRSWKHSRLANIYACECVYIYIHTHRWQIYTRVLCTCGCTQEGVKEIPQGQKCSLSGLFQTSSSYCCSFASFIISFIINWKLKVKCFPEWAIIKTYWIMRWEPWSVAKSKINVSNLRTHYLELASEGGAVLWDWALNLWVCTNSQLSEMI